MAVRNVQLDFSMPERLGSTYVAEETNAKSGDDSSRNFGFIERFIGILIEEYAG